MTTQEVKFDASGTTCGQCSFLVLGEGDAGECYRYPPKVEGDDDGYWLVRPIVTTGDRGCGEFRGAN